MQAQLPPNRLREHRKQAGLQLIDVAYRFRVHPGTVSRWESGLSTVPDAVKLSLAQLYSTNPSHLMGWDRAQTVPA